MRESINKLLLILIGILVTVFGVSVFLYAGFNVITTIKSILEYYGSKLFMLGS